MKVLYLWVLIFAALALGACSGVAEAGQPGPPFVRFLSPADGSTVSGSVPVDVDVQLLSKRALNEFGSSTFGLVVQEFPSDQFTLETSEFENGPQTLTFRVTDVNGAVFEDVIDIVIDNPSHRLLMAQPDQEFYSNGDVITLDLTYSEPGLKLSADLSTVDTAFVPTHLDVEDLGAGKYRLRYRVSTLNTRKDDNYSVQVVAKNGSGASMTDRVGVRLLNVPMLPITVSKAVFIDRSPSQLPRSVKNGPEVTAFTGFPSLVTGVPLPFKVQFKASGRPVNRLFVRVLGYHGVYLVRVSGNEATIEVTLEAPGTAGVASTARRGTSKLELQVAAADESGKMGPWRGQSLQSHSVGTGNVTVTLMWAGAVDLDLHVTTPSGKVINYANRTADGGELDLDSNASCIIDNRDTEHVVWPEEAEPNGTYKVNVNLYSACREQTAVYFAVVTGCGTTNTFTGIVSASDADADGPGASLPDFVVDCERVHGTVEYETAYEQGSNKRAFHAARALPVRVEDVASGKPVAEGTTNRAGRYALRFPATKDGRYRVVAEARYDGEEFEVPAARVVRRTGTKPYEFAGHAFQFGGQKGTRQDLRITTAKGSGALNILATLVVGYQWLHSWRGVNVPPFLARWERGTLSGCGETVSCSAPVAPGSGQLHELRLGGRKTRVNAKNKPPAGADEFNDSVIAHEFMHYAMTEYGFALPGGAHATDGRSPPAMALSEGLASAFAQHALGSPHFFFPRLGTNVRWDMESGAGEMPSERVWQVPAGTSDDTMTGDVAETLVSIIAWDLLDPVATEENRADAHDRLDAPASALGSVFEYLHLPSGKKGKRPDAGAGGVDLVDYLNGFRCQRGEDSADPDLEALFWSCDPETTSCRTRNYFPYDFKELDCPQ